jgi:WD40 repeat protein
MTHRIGITATTLAVVGFFTQLTTAAESLPAGVLQRLGSQSMRQPGGVTALLFSGQGSRILGAGTAGAIYSWDASSGELVGRFGVNSRSIDSLLSNAEETSFYATSMEQLVIRFHRSDLSKPEELRLPGVYPVVSPIFDRMCVVNSNGVDYDLLDADGKYLRTIESRGLRTVDASFSDDGAFLAISTFTIPEESSKANRKPLVRIVKVDAPKSEEEIYTFHLPEGLFFKKIRFLPGNRKLIGAAIDGQVRILDIDKAMVESTAKFSHEPASAFALSPDRTLAAVGDGAGNASIFAVEGLALLQNIPAHRSPVTAVAFSPDGKRIATGGTDSTIRIFDVESGAELVGPRGHDTALACIDASSDGRSVAVGTDSGMLTVWNLAKGEEAFSLAANIRAVHDVEFSPTENIITTGGQNGEVTFFESDTGKERRRVSGAQSAVMDLEYTRDGGLVFVAFADGTVSAYDPRNGEMMRSISAKSQSLVFSMAVSDDASRIAVGASAIRIVDSMGAAIAEITDCHAPVETLAFARSDSLLVAGLADGSIRVYDTKTWKEIRRVQHGPDRVKRIRISPDGTHILLNSETDSKAHLYELDTLKKVRSFDGHSDIVTCVGFLDNERVITGSADTTALVWKR